MKNVNYVWDQSISIYVLKINVFSLYKGYVLIKSPNEIDLSDKNRLWAFDHAGIKLIFKEYEVAAYAAGMPEVFIPVQVYQ